MGAIHRLLIFTLYQSLQVSKYREQFMYQNMHVTVIIPALNEVKAIGLVVSELAALRNKDQQPLIDDIIVCDNGSTDATATIAQAHGARVIFAAQKGYGAACQAALACITGTDIVLFVDGDHSCVTDEAITLLEPIVAQQADLVIGTRALGHVEKGAMSTPQRYGNMLAVALIRGFWQHRITDLGPYRAIRYAALLQLNMQDMAFGWTVEMQVKAIQQGLNIIEIPVSSLRRIGKSKISGTLKGVFLAGIGILGMITRLRWQQKALLAASQRLKGKQIEG